MKKIKKKRMKNHGNLDKEIRGLQAYQEECVRVEEFFEQSLREVLGEELKRFGWVWGKQVELFGGGMETMETKLGNKLESSRSSSEATLEEEVEDLGRAMGVSFLGLCNHRVICLYVFF